MIMRISTMSLNRIVEEQVAANETYRRQVVESGRSFLSDGRSMSDDDLLSKLHSLRIGMNRSRLLEMIPRFASAQAMSEALFLEHKKNIPSTMEDWVWIALTCLWERWYPDEPNMEMVDDKMQAGYAQLKAENRECACQLWIETWHGILKIMARHNIPTLDAFDERFAGTQCVFNWVQDFEMELCIAGLDNVHFFHERIALCSTMIDRFSNGTFSEIDFRSALASSYSKIGEQHKCDQMFQQWLDEDPQNGWGWIGWSDVYFFFEAPEKRDVVRAEMLLKSGLAVTNVRERQVLLERLADLYEETDRQDNADDIHREIEQLQKRKSRPALASDKRPPLNQVAKAGVLNGTDSKQQNGKLKTGRNDPCPCGSGKKFKKCCINRSV
jgi:hypothetical protein